LCLKKRRRMRRLTLSYDASNTLRLNIPYWVPFAQAERMVNNDIIWVKRYIERFENNLNEQRSFMEKMGIDPEIRDVEDAVRIIKARVYELSGIYNFDFGKITVRKFKSKWGSCSGQNNIGLNLLLAKLPGYLRDYVIMHELTHTRIKNHREEFWKMLGEYLADGRKLDRELKKYSLLLRSS